jgi:hypothetical protein
VEKVFGFSSSDLESASSAVALARHQSQVAQARSVLGQLGLGPSTQDEIDPLALLRALPSELKAALWDKSRQAYLDLAENVRHRLYSLEEEACFNSTRCRNLANELIYPLLPVARLDMTTVFLIKIAVLEEARRQFIETGGNRAEEVKEPAVTPIVADGWQIDFRSALAIHRLQPYSLVEDQPVGEPIRLLWTWLPEIDNFNGVSSTKSHLEGLLSMRRLKERVAYRLTDGPPKDGNYYYLLSEGETI